MTFFVAIPPGSTLRPSVSNIHAAAVDPQSVDAVAGYTPTRDSTTLNEAVVPLSALGSASLPPLVRVEGYEWYRGYRLARIHVSPYQRSGSTFTFASSFDLHSDFTNSSNAAPARARASDPHFREAFDRMVINASQLGTITQTRLNTNDSTGGWIPYGKPALKIGIAVDGIYRITYADIQLATGSASAVDPATFRLINRGSEVPLFVSSSSIHTFSPSDYVEFPARRNYGLTDYHTIPSGNQEYPEYLNRYTDTSTYWLTWGGAAGLRMDSTTLIGPSTDSLTWYTETVHVEQNHELQFADGNDLVVRQDPRWTSGDIWGWDWLYAGGSFDVSFNASDIYSGSPTVQVSARAASSTWPLGVPSYRVRLMLNSSDTLQAVDDNGLTPQILIQGSAPVGVLNDGSNTIHVLSLPALSSVNAIWFDWAEAEYPRRLIATGDSLLFGFPWITGSSVRLVVVGGIGDSNVVIYKFNPRMKRVTNAVRSGSGPFTVAFTDTVAPGDRYMLAAISKVRSPASIRARMFINLRDPSRGADYILITSAQFVPQATPYASMMGTTYSLRTSVVDVESIFDEFGYGYPTAESIRDFLKAAAGWQPPMPSYVFIAGDGTYDYKGFVTTPNTQTQGSTVVPTYGEPASDPWLAVLDDSSIVPQMYIGRMPVNSAADFSLYAQRVQSYITARNDDWNKRFIFFAGGDPGTAGQIESFHQTNLSIINTMVTPAPVGGLAADFYKTTSPTSDFGPYSADAVKSVIDNGAILINYIGHSGTQTWDNSIGSVDQLQNTRGRFALITDFGCSTAKFAEPDIKCFAELFTLDPDGCAIAYVGNTALGFVPIALTLPPLFCKQFLVNQIYPIGKAHLLGKVEAMNQMGGPSVLLNRVMMLTNSLLGDPALELALPKKPNLVASSTGFSTIPAAPSDDEDSLRVFFPYLNSGLVPADSFLTDLHHTYNGSANDSLFWHRLPLFQDTIAVSYPISGRPGTHAFSITLNSNNHVDEIQSDDNSASFTAVVLSNSFKAVQPSSDFESPAGTFVLLNPSNSVNALSPSVVLDIDTTSLFAHPVSIPHALGMVVTKIPLPSLTAGKRYYWRAGISGSSTP
ncbi:MAG TPA: C25 family cysteine peptidase, partial [Bacteroidota bacterium]|nr:C25 family cysteine peptidase [Bacteroidota bacterium]